MKLNFCQDFEANSCKDFEAEDFEAKLRWRTQPSDPLCLWQCLQSSADVLALFPLDNDIVYN